MWLQLKLIYKKIKEFKLWITILFKELKSDIIHLHYAEEIEKLITIQDAPFGQCALTIQEAEKAILNKHSDEIENLVISDYNRVTSNLLNMKINNTERIDDDTLITKVLNGWIYKHEVYLRGDVISISTTFVPNYTHTHVVRN